MIKRNPEIIEIVIDLRPKGTLFSGAAVVSQPPDRCSTLQVIMPNA